MGKFMADGSYAAKNRSNLISFIPIFGTCRILDNLFPVRCCDSSEGGGVGPDVSVRIHCIAGSTCINIYHLFNFSVTVPIILWVVNIRIGFQYELCSLFDGCFPIIAGVFIRRFVWLCFLAYFHRTVDVEFEIKASVRLLFEVVRHTAETWIFSISFFVEQAFVIGFRLHLFPINISYRYKLIIGESEEDDHLFINLWGVPLRVRRWQWATSGAVTTCCLTGNLWCAVTLSDKKILSLRHDTQGKE